MALIRNFIRSPKRNKVHKHTDAQYDVFINNGRKYLQIDTYGSDDRKVPGKTSQSIQLDEEIAKQLVDVIKREFGI